jgi:bifunctional non-homologous end joining protein LigD
MLITHPDRVIDKESGLTKIELVQYYEQIAPFMLPYLKDRPVYLLRAPEGVGGELFFQKHNTTQAKIPEITNLTATLDPKHEPYMAICSSGGLIGAVQMGTIELHTANATAKNIEHPDCMIFDLDPDPLLPWSAMVEAAELTKTLLEELGLKSFLKTSGGKGLHLVVPLALRHSWGDIDNFSKSIAQHLAITIPSHFVAKSGAKNRVGKIFVDYLRNSRKASTVSPFSARARPGLAVSVPIHWEELKNIDSAAMWNIKNLPQRLKKLKRDPWIDFFKTRQSITTKMKKQLGI